MDSREIEISLRGRIGSIVHFWGVYTSDKLPYVQYNSKPIIFIANTLHSNTPVTTVGHWVCFYIEFHPLKQLIFYDSYGLLPDFYSADFSFYIHTYTEANPPIWGVASIQREREKQRKYI